jgi:hypothetical protein
VNTFSTLLVSARQDSLLAEAAAERLARSSTPRVERPNRAVAAVKSVWSLVTGPAERPMTLPTLTNYPFRG